MRIIAIQTLRAFWKTQPTSEEPLKEWYQLAKNASWKNANDVKAIFGSASILGKNRVVFNIKGNDFRLVVKIKYELQIIYIRFIGTHTQYDKIDCLTI